MIANSSIGNSLLFLIYYIKLGILDCFLIHVNSVANIKYHVQTQIARKGNTTHLLALRFYPPLEADIDLKFVFAPAVLNFGEVQSALDTAI